MKNKKSTLTIIGTILLIIIILLGLTVWYYKFRINKNDANNQENFKSKITWDNAPEGTLLYAIKNDNAVTEPLTVPGAEPSKRTITADFNGIEDSTSLTTVAQSTRYYTYADDYKIDQKTGVVTLINPVIGKYSDVYSNLVGKYVASYIGSSSSIIDSIDIDDIYKITSASAETIGTLKFVAIRKIVQEHLRKK